MYESYADVLESYLIAEEANNEPKTWGDTAKSIGIRVGVFAAFLAALGIKNKLNEWKENKEKKKSKEKINAEHDKQIKEAFKKIDQRYKLSSMTKIEYNKFVNKMYDQIILDINKILKTLNSKELLNQLKNEYIKDLKEYNEKYNAADYANAEIKNAEKIFTPGLFKICDNQIGDYVCIIDGNQEVNTICHDICEKVADALILKYSEFCDAGLFTVGTGDGDEGCVYPEFVSYETMKKRIE